MNRTKIELNFSPIYSIMEAWVDQKDLGIQRKQNGGYVQATLI